MRDVAVRRDFSRRVATRDKNGDARALRVNRVVPMQICSYPVEGGVVEALTGTPVSVAGRFEQHEKGRGHAPKAGDGPHTYSQPKRDDDRPKGKSLSRYRLDDQHGD